MKLLFTAAFGLVLLTGASGPGPLKDSMGNLFTYRDEMAQMRGDVDRTHVALGVTTKDLDAQFQRMHDNGLDCTSVRYLGSVGDSQFVYVLHHGPKDVWYVLTLSEDGQTIAKVE